MRTIWAIAALTVALVTAGAASASPSVRFGIQDDAWLAHGPGAIETRVAKLDRLGLELVRVTLRWDEIETDAGSYDWRSPDALLGALQTRGLDPVVTLYGTPRWASGGGGPNRIPRRRADFARFAAAAAERYPFVRFWLVWNEPNQRRWLDPVSPALYTTRLLNPAYAAIKAAIPAAKVAGGVTAPRANRGGVSPVAWLRGMRAAHARLDAYAHNPYPLKPTDTPWRGSCRYCDTISMASLERLLSEVGRAFPRARVWLTEYGYQTNPPDRILGVSPARQAQYVGEAARRVHAAPKVDMLIHYLYRDEPTVGRWQSGLQTVDGRAKPALRATMLPLAQMSRRGLRTRVWGQVRPGSGPRQYAIQQLQDGGWRAVGGVATTSARGYLVRTLRARRGTKLRLWYPAEAIASPALVVR